MYTKQLSPPLILPPSQVYINGKLTTDVKLPNSDKQLVSAHCTYTARAVAFRMHASVGLHRFLLGAREPSHLAFHTLPTAFHSIPHSLFPQATAKTLEQARKATEAKLAKEAAKVLSTFNS